MAASERFVRSAVFQAQVSAFVDTYEQQGLSADRAVVESELANRVRFAAEQLGVKPATILSNHLDESWGRELAKSMAHDEQGMQWAITDPRPVRLVLLVAGELTAALGQVVKYASQAIAADRIDVAQGSTVLGLAADAVTGLGMAAIGGTDGEVGDAVSEVEVTAGNLGAAVLAIDSCIAGITELGWSYCACGEDHGQRLLDLECAKQMRFSLELLDTVAPGLAASARDRG